MKRSTRSLARSRAAVVATVALLSACALVPQENATVAGTTTLAFTDDARQRAITSEFWYAAEAGTRASAFQPLPQFEPISIAQGAGPAPDGPRRPLIVISHGNWGTRYSQGWLARKLVQAGYVVLSVSHPGTMNGDITLPGRARLWERARDVSAALDQLLAQPKWRALVDEQRIGFVGHSFGGFTGVSLAGGVWDAAAQKAECDRHGPIDLYCERFAETQVPTISREGMGQSFRDARFKAFYIMASGPAGGFSAASLAAIRVPFLVDSASMDDILAAPINSSVLARAIPGAREVMREVGHFTYVPQCRPVIGRALAELVCTDPPGVDRAAAHRDIERDVVSFFRAAL